MLFLGFYLPYTALALLLSVKLFRLFRPRGVVAALLASLLCLGALGLLFPLPIHGGFTFPLEMVWHELQREPWQHQARERGEAQLAFERSLEQRFAGAITLAEMRGIDSGWSSALLPGGEAVWRDEVSGLVWRAPQTVTMNAPLLTLDEAQAYCHAQPPQGFWALPTEAELALLWQHGGHHRMPGTGQSSTALLVDTTLQLKLATHYRGRVAGEALRCVALSDRAPRRGYLGDELPPGLWNRYQLSKGEIYSSAAGQKLVFPNQ